MGTFPSSFTAWIDDVGHLGLDDKAAFRAKVAEFKGREVVLTLQSKSAYRSLRANAYYHAVVLQAAVDETGNDADTMHAFWCAQFLPDDLKRLAFFNKLTGQRIKVTLNVRRTSKLTGREFYDFVEDCRQWLVECLGVTTPDPDPAYWRKRPTKTAPVAWQESVEESV
jgi:hypothetical protein